MVEIVGDIEVGDDLPHEPGDAPTYNESAYVNAFDDTGGGFVRIGNRVNEGYAEVTLCWYRPDGTVLFDYQRPEIAANDRFGAGGLAITIEQPMQRLTVAYRGEPIHLEDPAALSDPSTAFAQAPRCQVALDLDVRAIGPVVGTRRSPLAGDSAEASFLTGHLEQHVAAAGTLTVDGTAEELDARGLRDRSWGPRVWQALRDYRWLNVAFGRDLLVMATHIRREGDETVVDGAIVEDGVPLRLRDLDVTVEEDDDGRPTALTAHLGLIDGSTRELTGAVVSHVPLRNRRDDHETRIGESLTRYRLGDREALGIAEHLRQVR